MSSRRCEPADSKTHPTTQSVSRRIDPTKVRPLQGRNDLLASLPVGFTYGYSRYPASRDSPRFTEVRMTAPTSFSAAISDTARVKRLMAGYSELWGRRMASSAIFGEEFADGAIQRGGLFEPGKVPARVQEHKPRVFQGEVNFLLHARVDGILAAGDHQGRQ